MSKAPFINQNRMIDVDYRRHYRVRWQDVDQSGYATLPNYIRIMEETEYAFLRSRELSIVMQDERGVVGFPRISADVQVHEPVTIDDELDIWLLVVKNDGIKIGYQFELTRDGVLAATGAFELACCRFPPGKPPKAILIPDFIMQKLSEG